MSSPARPLRVGVIGCGNIAFWTHLRELRGLRGLRLVAAADPDPTARERARKLTGVPVMESAGTLLSRDDVDAVVIAAPTGLHAILAVAAAEAGKHLYLEKPIASTATDGARVVQAVAGSGLVTAMGFERRCHPAFEQGRALLASGRLGAVRAVQMAFTEPGDQGANSAWRRRRASGGGVPLDLLSHHVDQLRWTLGAEVTNVSAGIESRRDEHDTAWVALDFTGGVQALGYYSSSAGRDDRLTFICERGVLTVDRFSPFVRVRMSRRFGYGVRRMLVLPTPASLKWQLQRAWRPAWQCSYRRALKRFAGLCRGEPADLATLADGQAALEVVLATERAAAEGRRVAIGAEA